VFIIKREQFEYQEEKISSIQSNDNKFSLNFSYKHVNFMTIILVLLNLIDVISSFYAINVLGLIELNPLATGFPLWIVVLKFSVCFVPTVCAYMLDKYGMKKYLLLPFICSVILIEFYVFVVTFNMQNILGI
jgi:hypothetical protein